MSLNVGTVGHVDHGKKVLIVGDGGAIGRKLGVALIQAMAALPGMPAPRLPAPKQAKRLTDADLERIEAAEAKRQRRIKRNQQQATQ